MESHDNTKLRDKLAGCIIGCAVGDALGAPHEFKFHKKNKYTGLLYIAPEYHFQFVHRKDVVGQYTDDTEMTLCTVTSLIESNGVYDKSIFVKNYEKWALTAKAMGTNTRALFKGVKTLKGYENRYRKIFDNKPEEEWTQSNGSLMRCGVLSFFGEDYVVEDCKLTNPHYVNIDCGKVYSYMIRSVCDNIPTKKIVAGVRKITVCDEVLSVFTSAISDAKPERDVTGKTKGWVLHAFYCACWAWYHCSSYEEGIDVVIKMGGDTDTNAAITGSLLGAKYGLGKLQNEERTSKNIDIVLSIDSTQGDNPIPEWLKLDSINEKICKLCELLTH